MENSCLSATQRSTQYTYGKQGIIIKVLAWLDDNVIGIIDISYFQLVLFEGIYEIILTNITVRQMCVY